MMRGFPGKGYQWKGYFVPVPIRESIWGLSDFELLGLILSVEWGKAVSWLLGSIEWLVRGSSQVPFAPFHRILALRFGHDPSH